MKPGANDVPPPFDLGGRLVELCAPLSVTGREAELADALQLRFAGHPVRRVGDSLVVGAPSERPLVALVGHLDVVPPTEADAQPRVEQRREGPVVVGRGASDMKGGLVVAEALFIDAPLRASSPYELVLVLYAGEEGPADANELGAVLAAVDWLTSAQLAVVLEPTDLEVHLGCLGSIHAELRFTGRQTHSARPWHGQNALTRAGALLAELHELQPVEVDVDGVRFRNVLTATQARTRNARNVVPGEFIVNVNYRFAPDRTLAEAEDELRAWVDRRAEVSVVDRAPAAAPRLDAPLVGALIDHLGAPVAAKQAWTDVARFAAHGVPAVNYGPGLTSQAHQEGEWVPIANLLEVHARLRRFLAR
ncbi:MAG TPA: succinyl-diaminopimelate desuccinylase [Nitriliruptorales bacterium]|nr:succinyl-diaminopimelate desuccinylase [Nitriliruptorales bacterium]